MEVKWIMTRLHNHKLWTTPLRLWEKRQLVLDEITAYRFPLSSAHPWWRSEMRRCENEGQELDINLSSRCNKWESPEIIDLGEAITGSGKLVRKWNLRQR